MINENKSRRKFLYTLSGMVAGAVIINSLPGCANEKKKEEKKEATMNEKTNAGKLGVALVGLGQYSTDELAPALQETQHIFLAGIVSGTEEKRKKWKKKYDLPDKNIYTYDSFDTIRDNPDIHIVYVVLPNSMHAEYVIRAAKAGKHVICEKPMAISVEDCDRMIKACKDAGVMLSIGYRLYFEPHTKEIMRLGTSRAYGPIKKVVAKDGMGSVDGWRLDKQLAGGGPLMDVGIYCVRAAQYTTGMEPIAVTAQEGAKTKPDMFKNIEQSLNFQLEFPNGITADCACSYSEDMNVLHADAEKGWFELSPAYAYNDIKGKTSDGKLDFPDVNQQAGQMDDFALAIKESRPTPVPGEMGRQDVKILQAIYLAMESGQRIAIG